SRRRWARRRTRGMREGRSRSRGRSGWPTCGSCSAERLARERTARLPCARRSPLRGDAVHWATMTMASRPARHRYSYAEYLVYERDSGMKHEYDGGEIFAMAGGTLRHSALASRISAALEIGRKPGCIAFQSDQRVRILATGK